MKDRFWYINDAYIKGRKETKDPIFAPHGFSPLALEYNFSDFTNAIKTKEIYKYIGLAPFGKLPVDFFIKNKISRSENSSLFITDIIMYKNKKIKKIIYLKIEYFPLMLNKKRGWLITECGTMFSYYEKYNNRNSLFIDLIADSKYLEKYNLDKESPYFFSISGIIDAKSEKIIITSFDISNLNESDTLKIILTLENMSVAKSDITCLIQDGTLNISFNRDILTSYNDIPEIISSVDNNILKLLPSPKATFAFSSGSTVDDIKLKDNNNSLMLSIFLKYSPVIKLK
ncbi:MAG: hypothetical protein GY795_23240 [Desulfobacterales bacterium]|nr:hypothetical protein [Desulfobacterales bacterium]